MNLHISKSKNAESFYICKSYVKANGSTSSMIVRKLGTLEQLLIEHGPTRDDVLAWAKNEVKIETEKYKKENEEKTVLIPFHADRQLNYDKQIFFRGGYLFLQSIYYQMQINKVCRKLKQKYKFKYDINAILSDLIYTRILEPCSKRSSYKAASEFLEKPSYELHDVYRALDVLGAECDLIQAEVYKNSHFMGQRNDKILYYDCSNYYFEIEQEDGNKKYGKSKEHRPNPLVTMGLFMDADGIPLAFDLFPGNQNEQVTLKPLETKVIRDFECSDFIFCSDAGLGSKNNRFFNSFGNRSYVITYSLKKMKKEERDIAMKPTQFRIPGSNKMIDLRTLDETDETVFNTVYYKEVPLVTGDMDETVIVTYSPKYKKYQQKIRSRQIERAQKMLQNTGSIRRGKTQNDPARFIHKTSVTGDGEIAEKNVYELDEERIREEAAYDGFYAVVTNLEGDVREIISINKRRWEIEENFRIMKPEFEARPVYVLRDDRIKAHFLTCYISLLVYRLLEKKLGEGFTCSQILETLRGMNMTLLSKNSGYIPSYKRTLVTDALHDVFGFRTDYEFISKSSMRNIIKETKSKKSTKAKI